MRPGLKQSDAWQHMQEMLPVVRALWQGDVEHDGQFWQFPRSTSCPKPLQSDVPVWVAARSPITFDYALREKCNVMSWPLTRPFSEAELYKKQLDEAVQKADNGFRPTFAMMRHAAVYTNDNDRDEAISAIQGVLGQFENLFRNMDDVLNGFPKKVSLEDLEGREQYNPHMLEENLLFGSPDVVIEKLKRYQALGVDEFIFYASMGLGIEAQKRSLQLFCDEVIPAFQEG
jgi:alkanesulfonate monooxygenase SsuD/methylene tetrahydromethanopterin reductase-like flavin-dependent oxidoreductase (luciferase family)